MSEKKGRIEPTTYHDDGVPVAAMLRRYINNPDIGAQEALAYAVHLTKVQYLTDFPHDQQCRDVEAINREKIYALLKAVKGEDALPETFMRELAKAFEIEAHVPVIKPAAVYALDM